MQVQVEVSSTQVALDWAQAKDPKAAFYNVYRADLPAAFAVVATLEASATSYIDADVQPGATYLYRVVPSTFGKGLGPDEDERRVDTPQPHQEVLAGCADALVAALQPLVANKSQLENALARLNDLVRARVKLAKGAWN